MNQKVQNLIDDTDRLDEEIEESEDYDDKIGQHVDLINHFVMYKKTPARTSTPRLATGPSITNVTLPKLELPNFWRLHGLDVFFSSSNSQITDNQKLQYLKTSVKDNAAKLLTSLQVTDANFSTACDIPRNRQYNKRLTLKAHFHAIVSQRPVTKGNPKAHRYLMKTVEEHRLAFSNLGQPVNDQDIFFLYLIAEKLPAETRKCLWNFHHQEEIPNIILILKSSWKKERASLKQPHSIQHQPSTRSPQAARNFENSIHL